MKLINGKVTTTKPISLQKAAKYLSKFIYPSDAALGLLSVYLISASNLFNDLAQAHEQLKSCWKPSQNGHIETQVEADNVEEKTLLTVQEQERREKLVKNVQDKENRRHKKKKRLEEGIENEKLINGEQNSQLWTVEDEKKLESLDDGERRVDVKEKKSEGLENLETKEERRQEKKKRKSRDIENGEVIHSGDQRDLDKLEGVKKVEYFEDDGRKVDLKEKRSEGLGNLGTQEKKRKEKKKRKDSEL